ncbi:MAG TPA: hybrid sensor histidine kinase/response regulator [Isosphaeraceae bacterium]|jgi:signal transduction histidine kinase|nr:hybrid sensor histidine kinase/response regulator [Isosphaeraceae bacterium]
MNAKPPPTLLVVDDEPEVLHSVYDLFRLDYHVLTFERPAEALKALEQHSAHAVMTDQRMPEITGVQFLRQVKKLQPEATRLLFTGYADIKAIIDAINEGNVFRYITKPWDPEELQTIVRQAVEHHDLVVEKKRLVAELKQTNTQLLEANRLKGAFIEVASHELNTPVAVVLGMAELWRMMQGEDASPQEQNWVDRIQGAGKRLASTVERMIKLLRTDAFDHTLDLEDTEIEPLVRKAVSELNPFLQARGQEVVIDIAPGLGSAEVDPAKLGDILTNLIVNAIKFTPDGGTIRVSASPQGSDEVIFRVTDPGVGINPADRNHLFEPFFTGYDVMHHSSGDYQFCRRGIGLGLCLVKTFVELHGGSVEVTSAPGCGSTFAFTLPRQPKTASRADTAKAS